VPATDLFRFGRAVFPGEHLFGNNVSLFAYGALKELQVFDDGCADFLEVVHVENVAHGGIDKVPRLCLGRQKVAGAADGFNHLIHV